MQRDLRGRRVALERSPDRLELERHPVDELGSVSSSDVNLEVGTPERSDVAFLDLTLVRLRVDDPDTGRGNEEVIDIRTACARNEPVMERNNGVTHLTIDKCREAALAGTTLCPRTNSWVVLGDPGCNGGGMVAPPLPCIPNVMTLELIGLRNGRAAGFVPYG